MFKSYNAIYISFAALLVFALGVIGHSTGSCLLPSWQDRILETFKLFLHAETPSTCTPSWPLAVARYAAPYVVPFIALFATVKLALANLRRDIRLARARYKRRHVLVCGLGETGAQIVEGLRGAKGPIIAIDPNTDTPQAAAADRHGVPVLKSGAGDRAVLRFAGLLHARSVFICTGEDARNVDIALRIQELAKDRPARYGVLLVLVELRHEWLFSKLIDHDKESLGTAQVDVRPFNTYQNAARMLVQGIAPQPALDAAGAKPFVILGFGSMGREVALHLVRSAPVPLHEATRILVVDRTGEDLGRAFLAALPALEDFAEFNFVSLEFGADTTEKWKAVDAALPEQTPLAVLICFPDDQLSLYVALALRALFDEREQFDVPIFVRLRSHGRLGEFAAHIERLPDVDNRLKVFGSLEELLSADMLIGERLDTLARASHETYVAGLPPDRRAAPSSKPWPELPEHFKMSSRREADHLAIKLAQAGLSLAAAEHPVALDLTEEEIEVLARLEHRRWMIERRLRGWRPGAERDDMRRINPYLVDWEALPDNIRRGNRASISALPRMLVQAGMEVRRKSPATAEAAAQPGSTSGR